MIISIDEGKTSDSSGECELWVSEMLLGIGGIIVTSILASGLKEGKRQTSLHMVTMCSLGGRGDVHLRMEDSSLSCSHSWTTEWWETGAIKPSHGSPSSFHKPSHLPRHKSIPALVSGEVVKRHSRNYPLRSVSTSATDTLLFYFLSSSTEAQVTNKNCILI